MTTLQKNDLPELIDWTGVLAAPRYAGGHSEVMEAIFGDNAEIVAQWSDNDYQGNVAYAYRFKDGSLAFMTDSYGSCSGCDAWDGANDANARSMIESLVGSSRLFPSIVEALAWLQGPPDEAADYHFQYCTNLIEALMPLKAEHDRIAAMQIAGRLTRSPRQLDRRKKS